METLLEKGLQGQNLQGESIQQRSSPDEEYLPFRVLDMAPQGTMPSEPYVLDSQMVLSNSPRGLTNLVEHDFHTSIPTSPWFSNEASDNIANDSLLVPINPSINWKRGLALGPFSLPTFMELPSKATALELIGETFRSFNQFFPLFDEQQFLQQFHETYLESNPNNPTWWACINVIFSLAHRFRAMRRLDTEYENAQSCGYIHNALAVVSELSILHNSLPAVQALAGIVTILQGTPNPGPASVLVAAAVRLSQAMGLHRKTQDPSLGRAEIEQRSRVFWIVYFLDKDISLRMGQPFAQDDDDMDAELPAGNLSQLPQCGDQIHTINFFNSRVGLAVIQGQVYKRLYSVQATRQSEAQRVAVAKELGMILLFWRKGVELGFEDDAITTGTQQSFTIEFLHMLILRATYVNCLAMVDRHLPQNEKTLTDAESQSACHPSQRICVVESRKAIRLIQITPHGDYACVWLLLHSFFAAVTTLLNNVVDHPNISQAESDVAIVAPFLRLLEILSADKKVCSRSDEAQRMWVSCNELHGMAKEAMKVANSSLPL